MGSLFVLPAIQDPSIQPFDYGDLFGPKSLLVRIDDIALVVVLDDGCAAASLFQDHFMRIRGALSPLQLREVMAHLSYISLNLAHRPVFGSRFRRSRYVIQGTPAPDNSLKDDLQSSLGEFMFHLCRGHIPSGHPNQLQIEEWLRSGRYSFLFDAQGNFNPANRTLRERIIPS